ncbi:MAG TPA: hypothetical protein VFS21_01770 [Roseiflexaceae bacterium]|nr:hypothetical protein [Roseiflexaceae bacterium]
MTPDQIRAFFRETEPASAAEAAATIEEAKSDPEAARELLDAVYSLSVEDPSIAQLLNMFVEGTVLRYIRERAEADDAEALRCAELLTGLMEGTKRMLRPTPRGRPRRPGAA